MVKKYWRIIIKEIIFQTIIRSTPFQPITHYEIRKSHKNQNGKLLKLANSRKCVIYS